MRKHILNIVALSLGSMLSIGAYAIDTTITINGKVTAAPCTISNGGTQTVTMPDVSAANMVTAGQTGSWQTFEVKLTDCPAGVNSVTATFSGTPADNDKYANAIGDNYADNVAVQVQSRSDSTENLGNGKTMTVVINGSHEASFALQARPYSLGNTTVGDIRTIMMMDFTYN